MSLQFIHWLNTIASLQDQRGQCSAWSGTSVVPAHVVYQGSCIQALALSIQSHGSLFWGWITG